MSFRTAKFLKALTERANAQKRVAEMVAYESGTIAFEVREKEVLEDLFNAMMRRANQGFSNLSTRDEPALKRIEIQTYMKKQGFTFSQTYGCDAVFWDKPQELK